MIAKHVVGAFTLSMALASCQTVPNDCAAINAEWDQINTSIKVLIAELPQEQIAGPAIVRFDPTLLSQADQDELKRLNLRKQRIAYNWGRCN